MISKELLNEVLELNIVCVSNFLRKDNMLEYQFLSSRNKEYGLNNAVDEIIYPPRQINIYELAHKCKECIISNGFDVLSGGLEQGKYSCYLDSELELTHNEYKIDKYNISCETLSFYEDTEYKAIFKACEYIMENKCGS